MKTTKQMQEEIQEVFPFIELIESYKGANKKISLRCNKCGYEWKAVPRSIKNSKKGCPKCATKSTSNLRSQKAKESFFNQFELIKDKVELISEYVNSKTKIKCKCKICGADRETYPDNILRYGCPKCGYKKTIDSKRSNKEEFINKANKIHNNFYNYDKVLYINCKTPVIITCPIHGDFAQTPSHHLRPEGCPKCVGKNLSPEERKNIFIKKAKSIHGNLFDYSLVNFSNFQDKKVDLKCNTCNYTFRQFASSHLQGYGCPNCRKSHGEILIKNILNDLQITYKCEHIIQNPYNNTKFRVDFYIDYGDKYIIEYNGLQHYKPVEYFGGEEKFKKQQQRDFDLRKYCKENNINLLEIKYDEDFDKNTIIKFLMCRFNKELLELLASENGEDCDVNPVISEDSNESSTL